MSKNFSTRLADILAIAFLLEDLRLSDLSLLIRLLNSSIIVMSLNDVFGWGSVNLVHGGIWRCLSPLTLLRLFALSDRDWRILWFVDIIMLRLLLLFRSLTLLHRMTEIRWQTFSFELLLIVLLTHGVDLLEFGSFTTKGWIDFYFFREYHLCWHHLLFVGARLIPRSTFVWLTTLIIVIVVEIFILWFEIIFLLICFLIFYSLALNRFIWFRSLWWSNNLRLNELLLFGLSKDLLPDLASESDSPII